MFLCCCRFLANKDLYYIYVSTAHISSRVSMSHNWLQRRSPRCRVTMALKVGHMPPSGQQIPGHVSVFRRHIMVTKPVSTLSRYRGRRRRPGRRVSSRPDILDVYKTATTTTTTTAATTTTAEINNYRKPKRTTVGPVGPPTTAVVSATLRSFEICRAMQLSPCIEAIGVRNLNQTNGRSVRLTALMMHYC